jgi:hypothetical protein
MLFSFYRRSVNWGESYATFSDPDIPAADDVDE